MRKVLLIVLDGWGMAAAGKGNAISRAKTPFFDDLWLKNPHLKLIASGEAVGLPKGQIGNSEVGHLNLGAGRVVFQDLPRISKSIRDGSFAKNPVLRETFRYCQKQKRPLHLIGLVSDGGVHSHLDHLYGLLETAKKGHLKKVYIHVLTDGRDVGPKTALTYIKALEKKINFLKIGRIATISGRYYAMDRDNRWPRTAKAYHTIVIGEGRTATSPEKAIESYYNQGFSDEFLPPTVIERNGLINDKDAVIFFNFRADRPRQLTRALIEKDFPFFERKRLLKSLYFVTMTEYRQDFKLAGILFPPQLVEQTLAEVLAEEKISQLHLAETEKYAHVTYFFNGGRETPFPLEERILVPSPKVSTYDIKPEMSANKVADETISRLKNNRYQFVIVNFANADMVGHSGKITASIKACEAVDANLARLVTVAGENDYQVLIVADHGNAEKMLDSDGKPVTAHTTNLVPFIYKGKDFQLAEIKEGKLANVATTILDIMEIDKPHQMTEKSLLKRERNV